jgi:hypothetical protein
MTLQELAALPEGSHVRLFVQEDSTGRRAYVNGTIVLAGLMPNVMWNDGGATSIIDTKSRVWTRFVGDMELA